MGALEELKKEVASDLILKKQYEIETEIYNIAICLKRIRKEKKLTQKDVAQRTGLTQQMISKIESYNVLTESAKQLFGVELRSECGLRISA